MELFSEILNNSFVQVMILGPSMGIIFGAFFAGLTQAPSSNIPLTVIRTREVYVTRMAEHRAKDSVKNSDNDVMSILIVFGIGLLFVIWKYAILVNTIHFYIAAALLAVLSFSITTALISFAKGHFTSKDWWLYIISPIIILSACVFLLNLAHTSFDPAITKGALENTFFQFYTKWLSSYGRSFMFFHVFGVILLCIAILFTSLALLHYLSLMNQRSSGITQGLWSLFARFTLFFSGKSWLVFTSILLIISFLTIEPTYISTWVIN
jgi:hypothetical protein